MWRWIAVALTTIALLIGLWGVYGWWRTGTPPVGDISLQSVTPPGSELSIHSQRYCDKAVAGFWATGSSTLAAADVQEWFDARFGKVHEEATVRLNQRSGPGWSVYEDATTLVSDDGAGTSIWVMTYDTAGHHCLKDDHDPWDLENAAAFLDACDRLIIEFWGVEYGEPHAADPPADWATIAFAGGRALAHSIDNPSIIYARVGPNGEWSRYTAGSGCFLD